MSLEINSGDGNIRKKDEPSSAALFEMEKTRQYLMAKFSKNKDRISVETIRPLPSFLGITGPSFCLAPTAYNPPSKHLDKHTLEKIKQRVDLNFAFFLSNYALIAAGTFVVLILLHPKMIVFSLIVFGLWKLHATIIQHSIPLVVMGRDIGVHPYLTVDRRVKLLYGITAWVVVVYCLRPFLLATTLTVAMVVTHAVLRDPKQIEGARYTSVGRGRGDSDDDDDSGGSSSSGSEVLVDNIDSV